MCFGNSTGSLTVTPTAGTTPYTYAWSGVPVGGTTTTLSSTTATASNLASGTYTVTITDVNNCIVTASATIAQPTAPLSTGNLQPSPITCGQFNGTVLSNPSGGTTPYTYNWSPAAASGSTGSPAANTQNASNLNPGTYTLTITDANGCTAVASATIDSIPVPQGIVQGYNNVTCFGLTNGNLNVFAFNGTPNYSYSWSNGFTGSATLSNVGAGTYTVTITDANNCVATASATISQPAAPLVTGTIQQVQATCGQNNGTLTSSPSGGTLPYTYRWAPVAGLGNAADTSAVITQVTPGTYTLTITDAKGCSSTSTAQLDSIPIPKATITANNTTAVLCFGNNTGSLTVTPTAGTTPYTYAWSGTASSSTGATAGNLSSGTYTVTITDANACYVTTSAQVTQPIAPLTTGNLTPSPITCAAFNGSITSNPSGGTTPYTYNWSPAAASGSTSSPAATTQNASNLSPGTYTLTITDANGCSTTSTAQVDSIQVPVAVIQGSINVACYGQSTGSLTVFAYNGTPSFNYSWSTGYTGGPSLSAITSGNYTVTVTDNNGCIATAAATINQPAAPLVTGTIAPIPSTCSQANGSLSVNPTGGTSPYSYAWSNSQTSSTITGLLAGAYTVTVTDDKGCSTTNSIQLKDLGPANVNLQTASSLICVGQATTITANVTGGTQPYTYSWSTGPNNTNQQIVSPIATSTYSLVVTDSAGCSSSAQSITVNVRAPLNLSVKNANLQFCQGSQATLNVHTIGGTGSQYAYTWLPNVSSDSTAIVTAAQNQTYTVTVNDQCSNPVTVAVPMTISPLPTVSLTADQTSGCGTPLCVNFTGIPSTGKNLVQHWNFGDNSAISTQGYHCYTDSGKFNVTLTVDSNGCSATQALSSQIHVIHKPVPVITYSPNFVIQDSAVIFVDQTANSIFHIWNFGDPTSGINDASQINPANHIYQNAGTYQVTLTSYSDPSCQGSTTVEVEVHETCHWPTPDKIANVFTPNNDGHNDVFQIPTAGLTDIHVTIYNRWGTVVSQYEGENGSWDGKTVSGGIAPEATYFYTAHMTCPLTSKSKDFQGFIELNR